LKRRVLTVALAIVLAVLGTAGVLAYVHKADSRALDAMKPVTVVVAQGQIPAGTSASSAQQQGLLRSERLPASSVPPNAVRSITPALASLVVSAQVPAGQLLLRPMLVTSAQATATGALAIPAGMVAVTIPLCVSEAVADYVQPGSHVAVFDTYPTKKVNLQETCSQSGQSHQAQGQGAVITRIVLPRVLVLATGQAASSGATGTTGTTGTTGATTTASGGAFSSASQADPAPASTGAVMVTLAVSQANAERLIVITRAGLPYLALLTSSSQTGFDTGLQPLFQR
jgi:pilus assembly protein CpaB